MPVMCAQPRVDPLTEDQARELLGERGRPLNIFLRLAKNEPLFTSFMQLGGYLLGRQFCLDRRERELVILRVAWRSSWDYEFGQHTVIDKHVGVTEEEIVRLTQDDLAG